MEHINRLKVVLVEKQKTGKWLAEQLEKDPATVSRWCSNETLNYQKKPLAEKMVEQ